MTIASFDTNDLVTLLVDEEDSDVGADAWDACDLVTSSRPAHQKARKALAAVA